MNLQSQQNMTNLPVDDVEIHVHTTRQQDRCVYAGVLCMALKLIVHMVPSCRDQIRA